jgi:Fe-S-cluster formation regulator IscX/YfhJ
MFGDDEFELNDDELSAESQMSIADEQKVKVLNNIKTKIEEAISNLNYSEKEEFKTNFSIIARYVSVIIDIENMEQDPDITEEELLEAIESIEITVKELSFQDLKEIENKSKTVNLGETGDNDGDKPKGPSSTDDDFDF